jgi:hypothetical protein
MSVVQNSGPQEAVDKAGQEHQHDQVVVQEAEVHYPSLQIHGFGDVDFSATDQKGSISGFNLGQFDLHFASALSKKVSYFGETTFTAERPLHNGSRAYDHSIRLQ